MALDPQSIEKRDFPIGRRGYEPDAVDEHLRAIATEVESLQRSSRGRTDTLASAASEQVRAIVEAAETSAAEIRREAEEDAAATSRQVSDEADRTRDEAAAQAREYVARVSEATGVMLQRVDAMESEIGALVESLRTGANRLTADLALLQGNMGELQAAGSPSGPAALLDVAEVDFDETMEADVLEDEPELEAEPAAEAPITEEPASEPLPAVGDDASEGARLIALNMALNGTPRDETDSYLAENFDLADRESLLDEVYAQVS